MQYAYDIGYQRCPLLDVARHDKFISTKCISLGFHYHDIKVIHFSSHTEHSVTFLPAQNSTVSPVKAK